MIGVHCGRRTAGAPTRTRCGRSRPPRRAGALAFDCRRPWPPTARTLARPARMDDPSTRSDAPSAMPGELPHPARRRAAEGQRAQDGESRQAGGRAAVEPPMNGRASRIMHDRRQAEPEPPHTGRARAPRIIAPAARIAAATQAPTCIAPSATVTAPLMFGPVSERDDEPPADRAVARRAPSTVRTPTTARPVADPLLVTRSTTTSRRTARRASTSSSTTHVELARHQRLQQQRQRQQRHGEQQPAGRPLGPDGVVGTCPPSAALVRSPAARRRRSTSGRHSADGGDPHQGGRQQHPLALGQHAPQDGLVALGARQAEPRLPVRERIAAHLRWNRESEPGDHAGRQVLVETSPVTLVVPEVSDPWPAGPPATVIGVTSRPPCSSAVGGCGDSRTITSCFRSSWLLQELQVGAEPDHRRGTGGAQSSAQRSARRVERIEPGRVGPARGGPLARRLPSPPPGIAPTPARPSSSPRSRGCPR